MSTVILDTITGKSTATTITIGSTPVVSASANSMTIRGEGSAQTSIQQGLSKSWFTYDQANNTSKDSFNVSSFSDDSTGDFKMNISSAMSNTFYSATGSAYDSTTAGVNGIMWLVGHDDAGSTPGTFTTTQCRFGCYFYSTSRIDGIRNRVIIAGDLA